MISITITNYRNNVPICAFVTEDKQLISGLVNVKSSDGYVVDVSKYCEDKPTYKWLYVGNNNLIGWSCHFTSSIVCDYKLIPSKFTPEEEAEYEAICKLVAVNL